MTEQDDKDKERRRTEIADLILRLRRAGVTDQRVVAAIESVPRDIFVPADSQASAYAERALPIDCGQTISAPVIVGMMTQALGLGDRDRVLEIGTGSGYQAAVLSRLVPRDRVGDLVRFLDRIWRDRLERLVDIPRTARLPVPEPRHDLDKAADVAGGGHARLARPAGHGPAFPLTNVA
jgi:protein-L-isoaspartate(D-aspartate) O-methyltransferase